MKVLIDEDLLGNLRAFRLDVVMPVEGSATANVVKAAMEEFQKRHSWACPHAALLVASLQAPSFVARSDDGFDVVVWPLPESDLVAAWPIPKSVSVELALRGVYQNNDYMFTGTDGMLRSIAYGSLDVAVVLGLPFERCAIDWSATEQQIEVGDLLCW